MKPPRSRGKRAFVDVNVLDVTLGAILEHQTVVVTGDRISSVTEVGAASLDPGTRVVSRPGGFLMPGLADLHVHLGGEAEMLLFLLNGVTTVRNMWGFSRHLVWRKAIEEGRLLGPSVYTTGPIMDGVPPTWNLSVPLGTPEEAVREVRRQKQAGYSAIKVYNRLSSEVYRTLVDEAKVQALPVVGHVPYSVGLEGVLAAGQRSLEHLHGWIDALQSEQAPWHGRAMTTEERPQDVEFIDVNRVPPIADRFARSTSWNCATLVVHEAFASPDEVTERLGRPEMRWCPPTLIAAWDPTADFRLKSQPPSYWANRAAANEVRRCILRELRKSGARILVGTDTPNPWVVPGFSLHDELDRLTECGYTPREVIRLATETAAEFLGTPGEFGVIRPGARADLLLLGGNPLLDFFQLRHVQGVMARGHWLPRDELDRLSGYLLRSYSNARQRVVESLDQATLRPGDGSLTYSVEAFGRFLGIERIRLPTPSDPRRQLRACLALDAPPGVAKVDSRWDLDASGVARRLTTRLDFFEGIATVSVRRTKDGYVLQDSTGGASGGATGLLPRTSDALIGPIQVASFLPVLDALLGLNPGEATGLDVIRVEAETVQLAHGSFKVARQSDAVTDGEARRTFVIEERWTNGNFTGAMELSLDGRIQSFRWSESNAELVWRLANPTPRVS